MSISINTEMPTPPDAGGIAMAEYIEREAARPDAICIGVSCQDCPFLKSPLYGGSLGCRIDDFIVSIPAADVRPVVRGKFEDAMQNCHDSPHVKCSVCGEYYWQYFKKFNFCPNCGADMRKEPPKEGTE